MSFRELQAAIGMGGPKLAQQAGPVGGGAAAEPIGDERTKWQKEQEAQQQDQSQNMKKGGKVSSASHRGDGLAQRGKTRGKMI